MSQQALAVDTGVAAPYLSRIETSLVNPTVDVLDQLANALGVEVDVLLHAIDPAADPPRPLRAGRKSRERTDGR